MTPAQALANLETDLAVSRVFTDKLQEQLNEREAKEQEIIRRIVEIKFGCVPGAIVTDRLGKRYRIIAIEKYWDCDKPWLKVNPQRKDGTFGTARRTLFSEWEVTV